MPSSSSVRITLMAISPRLATRTFSNMGGAEHNGLVKRAVVASFTALVTLAPAAPADAELRFKRCGGYGFACARLSVPLDRSGAVPGRVSLLVKRVRARRRGGATRPPFVLLAGGPGQSATDAFAGDALGLLYSAYRSCDLIVFDQRGTGRS